MKGDAEGNNMSGAVQQNSDTEMIALKSNHVNNVIISLWLM